MNMIHSDSNYSILNKIDKDITLLLDNLPVGIVRLNKNKECIYVNKFIYDFFMILPSKDESTILYEIFRRIHPEDLEKMREDDEKFLLDKMESENIFRVWRENIHTWVWVSNKKIIIKGQNQDTGDILDISYMYTFQDVNETKMMEIQLINERLKVEKAYNHKSIFLANMSHELRTPINGILGMLTLLEDTELKNNQKDYIHMIKECSFNLMTIINDILDYSKLEIGKIILDNKPMNIVRCIESVNDIIISRVIEKSIDYSYNINSDVPLWILGDCNRLKQIILNLISNSIKFTDTGSVFLNVENITKKDYFLLRRYSKYSLEESDKTNDDNNNTIYIRFDITDSGCGIDIEEKDKLFKSFSQVENKITNKIYQGTGLGLAICKELVELMGGFIWLDWTEINGGSRFSFVIKSQITEMQDEEDYKISDTILQDLNILILDDNVYNRISLTAMVNKWGMKAYSFSNAEEALYFSKITQFDIGLIDISIPKLDGRNFAKKLREIGGVKNKKIQLIALSSLGEKISEIDDNFICYIPKPVKEMRLKQKCQEIANFIKNINTGGNLITGSSNVSGNNINNTLESSIKTTIRILVAEDVYINQKVLSNFLLKLGFTNIELVENGAQCLEKLCEKEYDIVLLDIRMPLVSGDMVLKQLIEYYDNYNDNNIINKKFKNSIKPYVIAITAYSLKGDKNKYLEMGFDDYIAKPINIEELSNCLNKYINQMLGE